MCSRFSWTQRVRDFILSSPALLFLVLFSVVLLPSLRSAAAQAPGPGGQPVAPREVNIGGQPPLASSFQRCVDVEIGGDHGFGCLNQQLKREVERVNPSLNLPPIDARSPDVRVGNVNEAAIRQQYGSNYGRSVVPFRPPAAGFVVPHH